jgi:ubiquinone biosynthesis protein UbiJ
MSIQRELDAMVTAVIETGLNLVIKQQSDAQTSLTRLKGKVLKLHLQEINKSLYFVFSQQVDVLAQFEGESDCSLGLSVSTLGLIRDKAQLTQLIKQDKLTLEGDLAVAQAFAQLLQDSKPDVEEWMSKYTGDIVAHTVVSSAKGAATFVVDRAKRSQRHVGFAITEEWKIAPPALELAYFCDQVDATHQQMVQLEQRLQRLSDCVSAKDDS